MKSKRKNSSNKVHYKNEEELAKTKPLKKLNVEEMEQILEETNNQKEETQSKNTKLLYVCLGVIGLLLVTIIFLLVFILNDNKTSNNNKEIQKELSEKEYQAIIDSYADAAFLAVQNYSQKNNGLPPTFSAIEKQIIFESYDVSCDVAYVNYDGSLYLKKCKIDNYKRNDDIKHGRRLTEPKKTGDKLYFYKIISTYQNTATGLQETQTYYNTYKEEYVNTNVQSELLGIYECYKVNCDSYDIDSNTLEVIMQDGDYYIYNLSTKSKRTIGGFPLVVGTESAKYTNMKFIKNDQNAIIISLVHNNEKSTLFNITTVKDLTNFKYSYITEYENLTAKGYVLATKKDDNNNYLVNINNGVEEKVITNVSSFSEYKIADKTFYKAYKEESISPPHVIYTDNFEPLIKEFDSYEYAVNSNNTLTVIPTNSKKFYVYDLNGNKIYTSKDYNNFQKVVKDHLIILTENNDLKIIDTAETELATLLNVKENHRLHPMISGWYTENGKNGIYFVVENKDISYGTLGSGMEYYYIPTTKETGVIETEGVGGYAKPVLYLYPTKKTKVTVDFAKEELLTTTYPKFKKSWQVTANPNGDLYDKNGNYYYGLYWEEEGTIDVDFTEGFYVEKDDAIEFLETKLEKIGLNPRERNEFIMYWLPILEKNEKNLVYFELTESRENYNKLIINPQPDSLLRIAIHIKKVDEKTDIKEQKLKTFKRIGFTAVEWGGVVH